jgi:hypothetical protein
MKYLYTQIGYQTKNKEKQQACQWDLYDHNRPKKQDAGKQGIDHRFHRFFKSMAYIDKKQEEMFNEADSEECDDSDYQTLYQVDEDAQY